MKADQEKRDREEAARKKREAEVAAKQRAQAEADLAGASGCGEQAQRGSARSVHSHAAEPHRAQLGRAADRKGRARLRRQRRADSERRRHRRARRPLQRRRGRRPLDRDRRAQASPLPKPPDPGCSSAISKFISIRSSDAFNRDRNDGSSDAGSSSKDRCDGKRGPRRRDGDVALRRRRGSGGSGVRRIRAGASS